MTIDVGRQTFVLRDCSAGSSGPRVIDSLVRFISRASTVTMSVLPE